MSFFVTFMLIASLIEIIAELVENYKKYKYKKRNINNKNDDDNKTIFIIKNVLKEYKENCKKQVDIVLNPNSTFKNTENINDINGINSINQFITKSSEYDIDSFIIMKQQYLNSPEWNTKRKQVLKRDNYTCQHCGRNNCELHVHHKCGYKDIPNESINCLITLCKNCHQAIHNKYGYPQTLNQYFEWNH